MAMSPRHLAPARRAPAPRRSRRDHLRVIPGGKSGASVKIAKKRAPRKGRVNLPFLVTCTLAVALCVFSLIFLNIMVAQRSFRLAELQSQVAEEEAKYREMRLKVATAESPEKVSEAAAVIGLVVPSQQKYIVGPPEVVELAEQDQLTPEQAEARAMPKSR